MVDCRLEILPRRGECEWKLEFFISDIDVHQNTDFSENITLLPLITGVLSAKILKTVRVNVYSSAKKHLLEYCGWLFMCNVHQCQSGRTLQDRKLSVSDGPPPEGALGTAKTQNYIRYLPHRYIDLLSLSICLHTVCAAPPASHHHITLAMCQTILTSM